MAVDETNDGRVMHLKKEHGAVYADVADIFMETFGGRYRDLEALYKNPNQHIERTMASVQANGTVVGGLKHSYCFDSGDMLIDCVAVHPKHQRKGIGRALVLEFEGSVQPKNIRRIRVQSDPESVEFWEKMGYDLVYSHGENSVVSMAKNLSN